jgi:hypothetical protein
MSVLAIELPALDRSFLRHMRELLAELLWHWGRQPLHYIWTAKCRWPKRFDWAWTMVHKPEWQKSTAQSVSFWLMVTPVVFTASRHLGHGVITSVVVSLAADWLVFGINRLWIWRNRQASLPECGSRNLIVWGATFVLNVAMAWLVISRVGVEQGRALLGCYGAAMNPVMFRVRDKFVFAEVDIREIAAARCRLELSRAVATGHLMLGKLGRM